MRTTRSLGVAGALVVAALVGGTLISAVSAAPGRGSSGETITVTDAEAGEYCTLYLETLAAELGVEADAIVPAARAAAISTIETMVANGDLPGEIGERMIARLESAEGGGCAVLGLHFGRFVKHAARAEFREGMWQAAADVLDLTAGDVRQRWLGGESLSAIAEAEGVDYALVTEAVLDSAADDLAAAVEAGRITQERADRHLEALEQRLDAGGQPPERPLGPRGDRQDGS